MTLVPIHYSELMKRTTSIMPSGNALIKMNEDTFSFRVRALPCHQGDEGALTIWCGSLRLVD